MEDSFHKVTIVNQDGSIKTLKVPVVQELVRHGIHNIPKMFLRPPSESIETAAANLAEDFPCISMVKLRNNMEERENERKKLVDGLKEWGMVLVSDHGIPTNLLCSVKEVIKGFFELSLEEKKKCVGTYVSVDNMGYGRNYVKLDDTPMDWIDRLTMKVSPKESTIGLNVWPQNPPNFREIIETYAGEGKKLSDEILQALAEALSLQKDGFTQHFDTKTREINVRINYYPPCPNPKSTMGISAHTDATVLTVLMEFGASGGLQVMHKHKKVWMNVPWATGELLVSAGDVLEIMSNGRIESPWHRAVTQAEFERYSLALFFNPSLAKEVEPIVGDDLSKCVYKKVVLGEYLENVYKVSPTPSKVAIKFAMV
ncbi:flavonol synthase/flavanone 3-hydroxylase-like isoform X1 [Amaranthus tricolor]|uniref:flavonol synthase/flavanone 3-hydroxylase-like isoform X1 n=1 Tax=Amaranthus tricolor TaxID=29722 RepID=UPI00258B1C24|nr:flavonol synthase/flavanone 3-hydroxylase-like isoform X1 [Amaranthus tricolor]